MSLFNSVVVSIVYFLVKTLKTAFVLFLNVEPLMLNELSYAYIALPSLATLLKNLESVMFSVEISENIAPPEVR